MSKICGLRDVSKYVRTTDRVNLNNTVTFVIGEVVIEVNGFVVSQKSRVLEDLVSTQTEIFLDEFVGDEDSIQECVELLYGGTVELNERNINPITKFSAIYQVEGMMGICLNWLKDHLTTDNLFSNIELGILIESVTSGDSREVLDLCRDYIAESVHDELLELSTLWEYSSNLNFVRFLLQDQILYFTLPVLQSWVSKESDVKFILDHAELMALHLGNHGSRSSDLIDKMSGKLESLELGLRIIKLQSVTARQDGAGCSNDDIPSNLVALSQDDFTSFSINRIVCLERKYKLHHYEFIDLILSWFSENKNNIVISHTNARRLWNCMDPSELSANYLNWFPKVVVDQKAINNFFTLTLNAKSGLTYQYYDMKLYSNVSNRSAAATFRTLSNDDLRDFILEGKEVVFTNGLTCTDRCGIHSNVKLKLVKDQIPCYTASAEHPHFTTKHIYICTSVGFVSLCRPYEVVLGVLERCLEPTAITTIRCMFTTTCRKAKSAGSSKKRKLQ